MDNPQTVAWIVEEAVAIDISHVVCKGDRVVFLNRFGRARPNLPGVSFVNGAGRQGRARRNEFRSLGIREVAGDINIQLPERDYQVLSRETGTEPMHELYGVLPQCTT